MDDVLVTFNKIILAGGQDDDFALKTFYALSTLDDASFLDFTKKKRGTWEEDQLEDEIDVLTDAHTNKDNIIMDKRSKTKDNALSGSSDHNDDGDSESKRIAFLAKILPTALSPTDKQDLDPALSGQPRKI